MRLANPFYKKPQMLTDPQDAERQELLSEPTLTPPVPVPPDWHFYVVDQIPTGFRVKTFKGLDHYPTPVARRDWPPEQVAVQIHQWQRAYFYPRIGELRGVAAWVIAERLLLRRGDVIRPRQGRGGGAAVEPRPRSLRAGHDGSARPERIAPRLRGWRCFIRACFSDSIIVLRWNRAVRE